MSRLPPVIEILQIDGDTIIHYRDAKEEIYFNQDICMREFASMHNICNQKNVEKMHIFRLAIEIYKFLSQGEDDAFFVEEKLKYKEWM